MLGPVNAALALPQQPAGPCKLSDTMTLRPLLAGTGHVYYECMDKGVAVPSDYNLPEKRIPAFGWAQIGRWKIALMRWVGMAC